jgi:hypothetical protein
MELIKALLLHDSKREIIMFIKDWAQTPKKYENKNQMVEDIQKFKEIYFHQ